MARKERKTDELEDLNQMEPIDIEVFGTDDDPCFGKLYDLSADECQRCGDSEFCALKMGQTLNKERKLIESKENFLDIEEEGGAVEEAEIIEYTDVKKVKKAVRNFLRKDLSYLKIRKRIRTKYPNFPKDRLKEIYNNYKK